MFKSYHRAWLSDHPSRDEAWLSAKLKEGFDVHHLDGDKKNERPNNLVLIEHSDHMMLHSGKRFLGRMKPVKSGGRKRKITVDQIADMITSILDANSP